MLRERTIDRRAAMTQRTRRHILDSWWIVVAGMLVAAARLPAQPDGQTPNVGHVATVNGEPIDTAKLDFLYLVRRVPEEKRTEVRERFVEELIDRRLIADFLAERRTEASPEELDARVDAVRGMIERGGNNPDEVFGKLGITDEMLKRTLALPLAWNKHVRRVVTEQQLLEYFAEHRARFDGSRRQISQIVLTLPPDADESARQQALDKLKLLKSEIDSAATTFEDAAREHSQSPSSERGGDMGWAVYGQRIPREIADVAFRLPVKQVSNPFRSRFGAHLLLVTDEEPGDLSLEDVRNELLAEVGRKLWGEQVEQERAQAEISRQEAKP